MKIILLTLTLLFTCASIIEADPIYGLGNECPTDAQMSAGYTRQYYVTDAIACVFDPDSNNIQGTTAEAVTYLGPLGGWTGLGEDPAGFTFDVDAGNDDGTFYINSPLNTLYNQFAVAIKDGDAPKWAIFLLPAGDFSSDWGFRTSGGDLSHFVLFARNDTNPCPDLPCVIDPQIGGEVPEPASMVLLGSGLLALVRMRRKLR